MIIHGLSQQDYIKHCSAALQRGWEHMAAGRPELAAQIFRAALLYCPLSTDLRLGFTAALAWSGSIKEAELVARDVIKDQPYYDSSSVVAHYYLGSLLSELREFEEANSVFSKYDVPLKWAAGATMRSIRLRQCPLNYEVPFSRSVFDLISVAPDNAEFVYVVCCDMNYLKLFAEALHQSIIRNVPRKCVLHFHVINPDENVNELFEKLKLKGRVPLAVSCERTDLSHLSHAQRKVYYSSARFFILSKLLEFYGAPLLVADADQLVMRDPGVLFGDICDIRMTRSMTYSCNIMSKFSASAVIVQNTTAARDFCDHVASYIAERMSDRFGIAWHLDQIALAVTELMMPNVIVGNLPSTAMHSAGPDDPIPQETIFWSVTYSISSNARKIESDTFLRYLA